MWHSTLHCSWSLCWSRVPRWTCWHLVMWYCPSRTPGWRWVPLHCIGTFTCNDLPLKNACLICMLYKLDNCCWVNIVLFSKCTVRIWCNLTNARLRLLSHSRVCSEYSTRSTRPCTSVQAVRCLDYKCYFVHSFCVLLEMLYAVSDVVYSTSLWSSHGF